MTSRTRFAPSPTGTLHIGSARTALFAYAFAKHTQGQFILRIEDTDRERSTDESIEAILTAMSWLGLSYDEGPIYQTERMERYQTVIQQLLDSGDAYYCTCSSERLDELRATQMAAKQKPRYDGHCRELGLAATDNAVVRFKNPQAGSVIFDDCIRGPIEIANRELDDFIIQRSDGSPTYNFCVVVDDVDMQMTHVIRGDDHINNTPRQINVMQALGYPIPRYAHVPMILGSDKKRLSKRHGATGVMTFREQGFLPQALLNYLARLGWAHGDLEIFSLDELVEHFSLEAISKSPAVFNPEKLLWLNQHYIKESSADVLLDEFMWHLQQVGIAYQDDAQEYLLAVIRAQQGRCKTMRQMAMESNCFLQDITYAEKAKNKFLTTAQQPILQALLDALTAVDDWQAEVLQAAVKGVVSQLELGFGKVAQPLRVAVTGDTASPSIDVTLTLLGRDRSLSRLRKACDLCVS